MKLALTFAAALSAAVGLTVVAVEPASAWCGWRCRGTVVVPAPVAVVPAPVVYGGCYAGPGNCYWRRDCWYDAFGRRFCD